jgi:hypothetical protein
MMTELDNQCPALFRKLDALKAEGKDSSVKGSEYMNTLYELRDLTSRRLQDTGLQVATLAR